LVSRAISSGVRLKRRQDAVVDFGFGVGEVAGESFDLGGALI
jgi:hypothetical protein